MEKLLRKAMESLRHELNATKEEESACLRDVIANLESTLKSEAERLQDMGVANHAKVRELEETIQTMAERMV